LGRQELYEIELSDYLEDFQFRHAIVFARSGVGFLYDFAVFAQDAASKEQIADGKIMVVTTGG
jgi:hypothetical protein